MKKMNLSQIAELDLKRNIPLFIFLYVFTVGSIEYTIRSILSPAIQTSISILYLNIFTTALLFLIFLIIYRVLTPTLSFPKTVKHLFSFFWLKTFVPIVNDLNGVGVQEITVIKTEELFDNLLFIDIGNLGIVFVTYSFAILVSFLVFVHIKRIKTVFSAAAKTVLSFLAVIAGSLHVFLRWRVDLDFSKDMVVVYRIFEFDLKNSIQGFSEVEHIYFSINQSYHLRIVLLLIEIVITLCILLYLVDKKALRSLFKNIKPYRSLHFASMVFIGAMIVNEIQPSDALDLTNILHISPLFFAISCMILTWQFTAMLNDIYDMDIDKTAHPSRPLISGIIDERTYLGLAILAATLSLMLSLLLGPIHFVLNFTFILAAMAYSIPPIRLKNRVYGYVCVGYASVVALLFGIYSPRAWYLGVNIGADRIVRAIPFFPDIFFISVLLFVVLSISPLINAVSDYEADRRSGVRSLYTVYGFEKGKKIVAVLIVILFLSPLLLINDLLDMVFIIPISFLASIIFYRSEDHRPVFGLYFIIILYSLLRFVKIF